MGPKEDWKWEREKKKSKIFFKIYFSFTHSVNNNRWTEKKNHFFCLYHYSRYIPYIFLHVLKPWLW